MKTILALQLIFILAVCGCSRNESPVQGPNPQAQAQNESVVVSNCAILRGAAERFAVENQGAYPKSVDGDTSAAGHTLLELVAGGGLATNPFTKKPTVPINGAAAHPGEIGYAPISEDSLNVGYIITGFGARALVAQISNVGSPEDAKVIANCLILRKAVQDYRAKYHETAYWPDDDWSYPVSWLLSDMRITMTNPFTGLPCTFETHTASSPGQMSYIALYEKGMPTGYVITGYGTASIVAAYSSLGCSRVEAIVVSDCSTLQKAINAWTERHGGLFPDDISPVTCSLATPVQGGAIAIDDHPGISLAQAPSGSGQSATGAARGIVYEVIRREGFNVGYRIIGYAGGSAFFELTNLDPQENATVRLSALRLKAAVEAFAARCGGHYPEDVDNDRTYDGLRVVDLLPHGPYFTNPCTGAKVMPANHTATFPGEIGYTVVHRVDPPMGQHLDPGYVISGMGKYETEIVLTNIDISSKEALVLSNCRTVQFAVEEFAAHNDGIYPANVMCDTTNDGRTVWDLLPGSCLLMNPFYHSNMEPNDGAAARRGQTGYYPACAHGVNAGYVITGVGEVPGTVIITIIREPER